MPLINIRLSTENQGKVDLSAMANQIINPTEKILKKDRDVTVVMIERSDELGFYTIVNKVCLFIVNLNITKDTNTNEQKVVWLQSVDHYLSRTLGFEVSSRL